MDKNEALRLALEASEDIGDEWGFTSQRTVPKRKEAITTIKEALAQPVQGPVAWAVYDKRGGSKSLHWSENHSPDGDANKFNAVPLYTAPPAAQPEQEALYGMNQDDWKDIVAAISKARDSRGIYLACRPADVFQDWFLALGTFKPKEKI